MSTTIVGGVAHTQAVARPAPAPLDAASLLKKQAAEAAVTAHVRSGQVVGLGTGSTMKFAIDTIASLLDKKAIRDVVGISTSERTTKQATELGIPLKKTGKTNVAIDGADEVLISDGQIHLIKGMGGALLQEKRVARSAEKFVVIVDDSKLVDKLGTKSPLPVEVHRRAEQDVITALKNMGGEGKLRMKEGSTTEPFITDNGNFIVDATFKNGIENPTKLGNSLNLMPGVAAHGLFLGMADEVIIAGQAGVRSVGAQKKVGCGLDVFGVPKLVTGAASEATRMNELLQKTLLQAALQGVQVPPEISEFITKSLGPQATQLDAMLVFENARDRLKVLHDTMVAKGETPPAADRSALPKTMDEAIPYLMDRLQLTAKERGIVEKGIEALERGVHLPMRREPIGGHSSVYDETFRTQMAVTDPGVDHLAQTLADPRMLDGAFVHMEIIDRHTEHMAPYSNPGARALAFTRLALGSSAPSTAFFGTPNYLASIKQQTIDGMDQQSAGIKYNPETAAHQMANASRLALNLGYSEAKWTMDGLSPDEVITLGSLVHDQAMLQEGEYISAAFNLIQILKDFNLRPADAPAIRGAPTSEERALMLKGSLLSIDAAKAGGFKKVTVDSASMTPPSYPLIEFFGVENLLTWADAAHRNGLETYGSGGMRDYHFPLLQFTGLDGVGVGFSIHEAPKAETPGVAGRLIDTRVHSALSQRSDAEKTPVGRLSVMVRMLAEKISEGKPTAAHTALHQEALELLKSMARDIDRQLDGLKSARDQQMAVANANENPELKKAGQDTARQTFEAGFKGLIKSSLADPAREAAATKLLARGVDAGVTA